VTSTDPGTRIAPTAFVGPGVELGAGVVIGPYAVLVGPTFVGDRVRIGPGAHVGGAPEIAGVRQNDAWDGDLDHHAIVIGPDTVLRDHVVVHHGSVRRTEVGARCWLFSHSYLAHDVVVGDGVTLSAGVSLGGHVTVGWSANLGLNASVHQRRRVGALAMVGMGTPVNRDVPPFATVHGVPARVHAVNRVGMARAGLADDDIAAIEALYAAGRADGLYAHLSSRVRDEFERWVSLPDPRPMLFASARSGSDRGGIHD
jgi:UDP-N-acetylglucosamine acyltransferase